MSTAYRLSILLMAAGESRRFNGIKQLAMLSRSNMLQNALDTVAQIDSQQTLLVLGNAHTEISQHIDVPDTVDIVIAKNWQTGLGSSISDACREVDQTATHVLITLADQVALTQNHFNALSRRAKDNPEHIVCTEYESQVGVPAIFPQRFFERLNALRGERGAKDLLQSEPHLTVSIPEAAIDIDTQEQLQLWQAENRTNHDYI